MILLAIFAILNLLDIVSTLMVLDAGGREVNPLMAWLMAQTSPLVAMLLMKAAMLTILYLLLDQPGINIVLLVAIFAYAAVVFNNFRIARRLNGIV